MSRVARKILFDKDIRALELNFYVVVTLKKSLIKPSDEVLENNNFVGIL